MINHFREISVRCRDQPRVHLVCPAAAQLLELLFLQDLQEFRLQSQGNIADLVEKKRSLVGQLETPAFAMSSLRVPVSPRIRTVESVGATRSTCPSTLSKAGLLPIICSNLRSFRSRSSNPNCLSSPTEPPGGLLGHVTQRSIVHCRTNALEQDFIVEWLRKEFHCTRSQGLQPHFFIAVPGDKNDGNVAMLCLQLGLQFQA